MNQREACWERKVLYFTKLGRFSPTYIYTYKVLGTFTPHHTKGMCMQVDKPRQKSGCTETFEGESGNRSTKKTRLSFN